MNDRNQVRTYSYDAINQLTGVGYVTNNLAMRNVSYQYDPVGNRQQVTDSGTGVSPVWYTANNLNQYTYRRFFSLTAAPGGTLLGPGPLNCFQYCS
jgi:YD repeat-containing protein